MNRTNVAAISFSLVVCFGVGTRPSLAETFSRPNSISARAVGMGGAFVAAVDDPSALHFNPAALSLMKKSQLIIGTELIAATRDYTPVFANGTREDTTSFSRSPRVAPMLAWGTRLTRDGNPSRLTFAAGVWNTYGGYGAFERLPGTTSQVRRFNNYNIELASGLAYQVNDVLSLGAALRFDMGFFKTSAVGSGVEADIKSNGFGLGATFGATVTPNDAVTIGLMYRTATNIQTQGTGSIDALNVNGNVQVEQRLPQKAALGASFRPVDTLLLSTELAWTHWSTAQDLTIEFEGQNAFATTDLELDWNDGYQAKVGGELTVTPTVTARFGLGFDTNVVPDRTLQRQWLDANKIMVGTGASFQVSPRIRLDAALEVLKGFQRTVEDNSAEAASAGWPERANMSPGEYDLAQYTLELAAVIAY